MGEIKNIKKVKKIWLDWVHEIWLDWVFTFMNICYHYYLDVFSIELLLPIEFCESSSILDILLRVEVEEAEDVEDALALLAVSEAEDELLLYR